MKDWIEKRMRAEGQKRIAIMGVIAGACLAFGLLGCWLAITPVLEGLSVLDSQDKVARFCHGVRGNATLVYHTATDTGYSFLVSKTSQQSIDLVYGISMPVSTSTTEREYHVWRLEGEDFTVLFCSENVVPRDGRVLVQVDNSSLSSQVIASVAPFIPEVYVLYAGSTGTTWVLAGLLPVGILLILISRADFWNKRTRLGKQLITHGAYRNVKKAINWQADQPLFVDTGITLLEKWALFPVASDGHSRSSYWLVPAQEMLDLTIEADDHDPSEIAARFTVANCQTPKTVYLNADCAAELQHAWRKLKD